MEGRLVETEVTRRKNRNRARKRGSAVMSILNMIPTGYLCRICVSSLYGDTNGSSMKIQYFRADNDYKRSEVQFSGAGRLINVTSMWYFVVAAPIF